MKESVGYMKEQASKYINSKVEEAQLELQIIRLNNQLAMKREETKSLYEKLVSEGENAYVLDSYTPGRIIVVVAPDADGDLVVNYFKESR